MKISRSIFELDLVSVWTGLILSLSRLCSEVAVFDTVLCENTCETPPTTVPTILPGNLMTAPTGLTIRDFIGLNFHPFFYYADSLTSSCYSC